MKTHAGTFVFGLFMVTACAARAQEPPPVPVPPQTPPPATGAPVMQGLPPAQSAPPVETQMPAAPATPVEPAAPVPLSLEQIRERRNAIFLMEGVLVNAVRLAAANTADQIQAVQPGLGMFTSAPAKAHGTYLETYGVFFHVEIPSVMPSVASIIETLGRDRQRQNTSPAQPTALGATPPALPAASALINPDAHYVESVKRQILNAMLDHSKALDLGADEWLTVEAREAQEIPGQISQPSTLVLRVRGRDLSEFLAGRLTRDEVLKRVQVRGF